MSELKIKNYKTYKKYALIIALDLMFLMTLILFVVIVDPFSRPNIKIKGIYLEHPRDITDFNLIDQNGHAFTKKQLKGHWSILFFGFTHCPVICPTTLGNLNQMYLLLQNKLPAHSLPQIIFISIDPKNDTVARLKQYINSYNPHFIGVKTEINNATAIQREFSIAVTNVNNTIIHSTDIIVLNPEAQIQAYFLYPHQPENMATDFQQIIK